MNQTAQCKLLRRDPYLSSALRYQAARRLRRVSADAAPFCHAALDSWHPDVRCSIGTAPLEVTIAGMVDGAYRFSTLEAQSSYLRWCCCRWRGLETAYDFS